MIIACPHCQGALDIDAKQMGERQRCPRCTNWVLIGRRADGSPYGVKVQPPHITPERRRSPPS